MYIGRHLMRLQLFQGISFMNHTLWWSDFERRIKGIQGAPWQASVIFLCGYPSPAKKLLHLQCCPLHKWSYQFALLVSSASRSSKFLQALVVITQRHIDRIAGWCSQMSCRNMKCFRKKYSLKWIGQKSSDWSNDIRDKYKIKTNPKYLELREIHAYIELGKSKVTYS